MTPRCRGPRDETPVPSATLSDLSVSQNGGEFRKPRSRSPKLTRSNEGSTRKSKGGCSLLLVLLAAILMPRAAAGLTPIDSADLSPDVTVALDGQTIADEDVASDNLTSGTITKALLGALPEASDLSAYHALGEETTYFPSTSPSRSPEASPRAEATSFATTV